MKGEWVSVTKRMCRQAAAAAEPGTAAADARGAGEPATQYAEENQVVSETRVSYAQRRQRIKAALNAEPVE